METDFISRSEALYCNLKVEINGRMNGKSIIEKAIQAYSDYISKIPAADVVEVIRCKDCKWYRYRHHEKLCIRHSGLAMVNDDSYCCYAERKENET